MLHPFALAAAGDLTALQIRGHVQHLQAQYTLGGDGGGVAVQTIIDAWRRLGAKNPGVVKLVPSLAVDVVAAGCLVLHVVAMGLRLRRKLLLNRSEPSAGRCKTWLRSLPEAIYLQPRLHAAQRLRAGARQVVDCIPASLIVDWVESSSYIVDVKKTWQAMRAFARIISRHTTETFGDIVTSVKGVNKENIRAARVRLDLMCMTLIRSWLRLFMGGDRLQFVNMFVYTDASPQWRGSELAATSLEVADLNTNFWSRRLLPVVQLDRGLYDATGKTLALLWQLWLCCGPSWGDMVRACSRIRAIVSDLGVERLIWTMPGDVFEEFFTLICFPVSASEKLRHPIGPYLFGRAVHMPGWKHAVDVLLCRCLASLPWFPSWLTRFKAVVGLLR